MPPAQGSEASFALFPTALGWMAIVGHGNTLQRLVFGYASPDETMTALGELHAATAREGRVLPTLVRRLKAFARGAADDFRDVRIDLGPRTDFQRRVLAACRRIGWGKTSTYGLLAEAAGCPRAARAVGTVMATNQIPLVIPCHRVLASGGKLGGYGNPLGLEMKKRLLAAEVASPRLRTRRRTTAAR